MHRFTSEEKEKIINTPLTIECFDIPDTYRVTKKILTEYILSLNALRQICQVEIDNKDDFELLVALLPISYKVVKIVNTTLKEENANLKSIAEFQQTSNMDRYFENKALKEENERLKKNYEDSLVAYGVLKSKIDVLTQPSPLESMQDILITVQKEQSEKQAERLDKAKEIIKKLINACCSGKTTAEAEQFLKENE